MKFNELFTASIDLILRYNLSCKEKKSGIKIIAEARKRNLYSKDGNLDYWSTIIVNIKDDIINNSELLFRANVKEEINHFLKCYSVALEYTKKEKQAELNQTFQTPLNIAEWYKTIEIKEPEIEPLYSDLREVERIVDYIIDNANLLVDKGNKFSPLDRIFKIWNDTDSEFYKYLHLSKEFIEGNTNKELERRISKKLKDCYCKIESFKTNFDMLHSTNLINNRWFLEFYTPFKEFHYWYFNEIIPLVKALPPLKEDNIDWISIFKSIDTEKEVEPQVYITNTIEQKKNFFSKASFNLTIQYLTNFKKETNLFFNKRKLEYLNSLNIEKPKSVQTESPLFNQTVFEAKSNYFDFLTLYKINLENSTPQPNLNQNLDLNETLSKQLTHENRKEIANEIINKYKTFKGVELRILLNALFILGLFPEKGRKDALFYRCCVNDFNDVGKYQSMEAKTFKKGYENSKGNYIKSEHEKRRDDIVKFLKSIINTK